VALRPSDLEEIGAEIERCFAHLHDRTSWDRLRRCFVLREAAGENMAPAAAPMPPVLRSVGRSRPQGGACMSFVVDLWLPIVASAAAVFVASALMHMLLPWHRGDLRRLPGEEALLAALRAQGIAPGSYMFPGVDSMKEMSTPEMVAKYERGPVGIVTVMPSGVPAMGRSLVQWFLFIAGISFFTAYIASRSLAAGAAFGPVLAIAGAAATLAYAFAPLRDSIWKGQRWGITLKYVADGVLYGVVTGLVFALLWPCAA
jgi:hypothetical protein